MQKFGEYLQNHWKKIAFWIITGLFFSMVIHAVSGSEFLKDFLDLSPLWIFCLLAASSLLAVASLYKPLRDLIPRYKNNLKLAEIPFTYVEGALLFFFSTAVAAIIWHAAAGHDVVFANATSSVELKLWLLAVSISALFSKIILQRSAAPSKEKKQDTFEPHLHPDSAIDREDEDMLDRKKFVADLHSQIKGLPFLDSFVFGLYGKWGEGKTSVINLLKGRLEEDERVIAFSFDPWFFSSGDAVIKGFYDGLYAALNKTFFLLNFKGTFKRYRQMLSSFKISAIDIDLRSDEEPIEELRDRLQEAIKLTGKKVVIIIDDIDRLHNKDDVMRIFKIVKLSAGIENTVFVLSFDPDVIFRILKKTVSADPAFLDKIVQCPVHLPAVEQEAIDRFLFPFGGSIETRPSEVEKLFNQLEIGEDRQKALWKDFYVLYGTSLKRLFTTLRDAKRFINGLQVTLPPVKDEVNLHDFLVLEAIRIFYLRVYDDIWKHPWYYIPRWSTEAYLTWGYSDEEGGKKEIREHIDQIIKDEENSSVLLELLKDIFFVTVKGAYDKTLTHHNGRTNEYRQQKRITHPDVFKKYFMLKVPSSEVPDKELEDVISGWNEVRPDIEMKIIHDLREFQPNKLLEVLRKLLTFASKIDAMPLRIR